MDLSLLQGWIPVAVQAAAAVGLFAALAHRDRRWLTRRLPLVCAVAGVLTGGAVLASGATLGDPLPVTFWTWFALLLCALLALPLGWTVSSAARRVACGVAAVLTVLACLSSLNQFLGYDPTVQAAATDMLGTPGQDSVPLSRLAEADAPLGHGTVVTVHIPDRPSGFHHRDELVWLPPVWTSVRPRPRLPVIELIGSQFGQPDDWVRAGGAVRTADAYAAAHHGWAPIVVVTDPNGRFWQDTECVNGTDGNAATHLTLDIRDYLTRRFDAATSGSRWGVAGWSMGGTCSATLAITHPGFYGAFEDISGDLRPNLGDIPHTVAGLYGNDRAAWAANDPLTVLSHHHRYRHLAGWFEDGTAETRPIRDAHAIATAARADGVHVHLALTPGGHDWQVAGRAFADALPWLCHHLGLAHIPHHIRAVASRTG